MRDPTLAPVTCKLASFRTRFEQHVHIATDVIVHEDGESSNRKIIFSYRLRRISDAGNMQKNVFPECVLNDTEERWGGPIQQVNSRGI